MGQLTGEIENTDDNIKKWSTRRWVILAVFFCLLLLVVAVAGGLAFHAMHQRSGEGLQVRPRSTSSGMIVLRQGDTNAHPSQLDGEGDLNADYVARTEKFLETYSDTRMGKRMNDKTGNEERYPVFHLHMLGECNRDENYGYVVTDPREMVQPCVFIELNPIAGWAPEPYNCQAEKAKGYHSEAPCLPEIEKHIRSQGADAANNVYINCRGRYPADQEVLEGGLTYFPANRGLPISYFPFKGRVPEAGGIGGNYHAPLVAVKISPRPGREGQLIHIECRAYYKGVKHNTETKEGMVTFELQIKNN